MKLIREYFELCEGGVCKDILTEDEKKFIAEGGTMLSGVGLALTNKTKHKHISGDSNLTSRRMQN